MYVCLCVCVCVYIYFSLLRILFVFIFISFRFASGYFMCFPCVSHFFCFRSLSPFLSPLWFPFFVCFFFSFSISFFFLSFSFLPPRSVFVYCVRLPLASFAALLSSPSCCSFFLPFGCHFYLPSPPYPSLFLSFLLQFSLALLLFSFSLSSFSSLPLFSPISYPTVFRLCLFFSPSFFFWFFGYFFSSSFPPLSPVSSFPSVVILSPLP